MKFGDTLKLYRFMPTTKKPMYAALILMCCVFTVGTNIPLDNGMAVGAFWALYPIIFFLLQIHTVLVSGVVQSSERSYRAITKNLAILIGLYNAAAFVIFGVLRTFVAYGMETEAGVPAYLAAYCLFQVFLVVYLPFFYKKPVVGYGIILVMMFFMVGNKHEELLTILGITSALSVGKMLGITAVVSAVSPFLYYGLSVLLYRWPYSDYIVKRLMREKSA